MDVHGRDWTEQRFSPLKQINDNNVERLGLAWYADLNTYRGVEATPLVIDGVLYNISAWDITTAYDARTGKVLWTYDPKMPPEYARLACCGPVSRGLAAWKGKIFIARARRPPDRAGRQDRQAGLERRHPRPGQPLSITGAPRIADGKVVIGNGGGDFGARGYITAYDAETGKQTWKFYIVPGDPAKSRTAPPPTRSCPWPPRPGPANGGSTAAAATPGTPSSTIPKLDLVYFGTGNGSPHPQKFRSPGGGDNLFLCSIVAVTPAPASTSGTTRRPRASSGTTTAPRR